MNQYILITSFIHHSLSLAKISEISFSLKLKEFCKKLFSNLKKFFSLSMFDHSAVDYPHFFKKRFLIYYSLISYIVTSKFFFFFRTNTNANTLYEVFPCSEWLERESYDFFGIYYQEHPDLRRILTDYGFPSYALRKDFPVQGYFDLVYSISSKKIQFKEIEFQQSFRVFLKENPYLTKT